MVQACFDSYGYVHIHVQVHLAPCASLDIEPWLYKTCLCPDKSSVMVFYKYLKMVV